MSYQQNTYTDYQYVRSPSGHSGAEIAVLRVPGLTIPPLEIAKQSPGPGDNVTIWGFARGKNASSRGLRKEHGTVFSGETIGGNFSSSQFRNSSVMKTTARVLGGNRGGPLTNSDHHVIGIAFDTPANDGKTAGWFFGASEMRRWFYRNVQNASVLDPTNQTTNKDRQQAIRLATIPVLCWGVRQKKEAELFSLVADISRDSSGIFIRDGWCIACDGKGFLDCPARGCNQGVLAGRKVRRVGTNGLTGEAILGRVVERSQCTTCNGHGRRTCPHCKRGHL